MLPALVNPGVVLPALHLPGSRPKLSTPDDSRAVDSLVWLAKRSLEEAWVALDLLETVGPVPLNPRERSAYSIKESIYQKAFVGALATVGSVLLKLTEYEPKSNAANDDFKARFPSLYEIRNSIQHPEDRVRWIGRVKGKNQRITPGPIEDGQSDGPLIMGGLALDRRTLIYTTGDGTQAHVVLEKKTVIDAHAFVQRAVNAFSWEGPSLDL